MFTFPITMMSSGPSGYQPAGALMLDGSADYLTKTFSTSKLNTKGTYSFWIKRSVLGTSQTFFSVGSGGSGADANWFTADWDSSNQLNVRTYDATRLKPTQVFRDPAWQHFVIRVDTTDGTAGDRLKIYLNGAEITAFATDSTLGSSANVNMSGNGSPFLIGQWNSGAYFSGYIADFIFIDDTELDASSFGETDEDTGIWVPKDPSTISSFGTNGFWLDFSDGSDIGNDVSGNNNDFTPVSVAEHSIFADGPANSTDKEVTTHPTVLSWDSNDTTDGGSFSNENKTYVSSSGNYTWVVSTFAVSSGKWYWEVEADAGTSERVIGISNQYSTSASFELGKKNGQVGYRGSDSGSIQSGISSGYSTVESSAGAISNGDVIGIALDLDSGTQTVKFYRNNSLAYTHNLHNDQKPSVTGKPLRAAVGDVDSGATATFIAHFHASDLSYSAPSGYNTLSSSAMASTVTGVGNYATFNPLLKTTGTFSNGNLKFLADSQSAGHSITSTHVMTSGTYYAEFVVNAWSGTNHATIGIATTDFVTSGNYASNWTGANTQSWGYYADGSVYTNGSATSSGYTSYTIGDVIGVKLDATNGAVYFYKNGTVQNSGSAAYSSLTGPFVFSVSNAGGSTHTTITANFGQTSLSHQPGSTSTLGTQNLPEPTITDPSEYFQNIVWTGNGSNNRALTFDGNSNLQPDLIWIKNRDDTADHVLFDSVRGFSTSTTGTQISPNLNGAQPSTAGGHVQSVQSDGFTLKDGTAGNADHNVNNSSDDYVGFAWKIGGAPTTDNISDSGSPGQTPTSGSVYIDGSVSTAALESAGTYPVRMSVNTTTKMSLLTYKAGAATTIPHGLGVKPTCIFIKNISSNKGWRVGFFDYDGPTITNDPFGFLDSDSYTFNTSGNTDHLSSGSTTTFGIDGDNGVSGNASWTHLAWVMSSVEGFSKIGTYTGNGSTDGPFVYTGHKSAWLMIKCESTNEDWKISNSAMSPYNPILTNGNLNANRDSAQDTPSNPIDYTSNGFKLRMSNNPWNQSGQVFTFISFAESPLAINNRAR